MWLTNLKVTLMALMFSERPETPSIVFIYVHFCYFQVKEVVVFENVNEGSLVLPF